MMGNPSLKELKKKQLIPQLKTTEIFLDQKKKTKKLKTILRDIKNVFRLEKENKAIKDIILRNIRNLFENKEEENFYKSERVSSFLSNNYIEWESNGDRNKTLSVEEYLNKSRPYLRQIINSLKKSCVWKI